MRAKGCSECGGMLHVANYPRKTRGEAEGDGSGIELRLSFCCASCRRRATPMSVRFLGRRVYVAVAVVLAAVMAQGVDDRRASRLKELADIDRRTLARWVRWWREDFVETDVWTELRGRFVRPCDTRTLPSSLLERIEAENDEDRLLGLLKMLRPLSVTPLMRRRLARAA